jgi:hypothetical protein
MNKHHTAFSWLLTMALLIFLAGCSGETQEVQDQKITQEQLAEIMRAEVLQVSPERVSEAFALGSDSTDLQRDLLSKELIGSVVEWRLQVYEVELKEGLYKVTTQALPIKSKEAVQLLRAVVFIVPSNDDDHDLMRNVKTNDMITVRGRVRDIVLRTVVVIEPALLVSQLTVN